MLAKAVPYNCTQGSLQQQYSFETGGAESNLKEKKAKRIRQSEKKS
jgi:hypothetical protein